MSALYELSNDFAELFDQFDAINDYEPNTDADGNYVDDDGNIIADLNIFKQDMLAAWYDTLEGIECEFEAKAENIACYIKSLKAEADDIEAEEKALKLRKEQKRRKLEGLKQYLKNEMARVNRLKIDTPRAKLSIRNNAESLVVDDTEAFIRWAEQENDSLLKYSEPEIRKTEVKKLVQAGEEIPNVHLERSQSLIIK